MNVVPGIAHLLGGGFLLMNDLDWWPLAVVQGGFAAVWFFLAGRDRELARGASR